MEARSLPTLAARHLKRVAINSHATFDAVLRRSSILPDQFDNFGVIFAAQQCRNLPANCFGRHPQRVIRQMRVSLRRAGFSVAQQRPDDWQTHATARAQRSEGVPKVMQPHIAQPGPLGPGERLVLHVCGALSS